MLEESSDSDWTDGSEDQSVSHIRRYILALTQLKRFKITLGHQKTGGQSATYCMASVYLEHLLDIGSGLYSAP